MRHALRALLFFALLGGGASATDVKPPPPPTRWVTDGAGLLSEGGRAALDGRLEEEERRTGRQFLVYIAPTTGDTPLEDWCVRAFAAWGVGRKGKDDGLVLFLFAADRKIHIEVGYGLEGRVPDAAASRIIREIITPKLQAGDPDGAVTAGVDALLTAMDGRPFSPDATVATGPEPGPGPSTPAPREPVPLWQIVLFAILGIAFLILLITHPSFALWLLFQILSAAVSGGGGGGSSRGGFSGGGGRSGGGGASGSW